MSAGVFAAPPAVAQVARTGFFGMRMLRLVRADVLERTRRPGYLITLLVMVWIAQHMLPENGAGYRTFVTDETYRPVYNAAWVGTITALLTGVWFMLVGFYLVRGSVERDRRTGVGQVLAATRMSSLTYLWSRVLSHLAVLGSQALVVAAVALVQQQLLAEDRRLDLAATLLPFLTLTLPMASLTAAAAVLFDCIRVLRGGIGNIVWFVLLGMLLSSGGMQTAGTPLWRDATAGRLVAEDVRRTLHALHPETASHPAEFSMGVNINPRYRGQHVTTFEWRGMRWNVAALAARLPLMALALLLVFAAAIPFDRFDAAAQAARPAPARPWWPQRAAPASAARVGVTAARLTVASRGFALFGVARAELALLLKDASPWWYAGLLGLLIAQALVPLTALRTIVLPIASFWPALLWSSLGQRERRHDTGGILFSCPQPVSRLLPAAWAAGALLMMLAGVIGLLRFALGGEGTAVAGWCLSAALVPAFALACGVWTGSAKFFEVGYLFVWYTGPMHHLAMFDYTGVTSPRTAALWGVYAALTVGFFALAWVGRVRQASN